MLRLPAFQAELKQFPWGRLEDDGAFNDDLAKARFAVLGASDMGFGSHRPGTVTHANQGVAPPSGNPLMELMFSRFKHTDGLDLLKESHLTDKEGWRLKDRRLIPFRNFDSVPHLSPPQALTAVVNSWKEWHDWRNLPLDSPASLLMSWPISVYWILVDTLRVTKPTSGSPKQRVDLTVHLLGAEVELNYIPLYAL
jgi:hypothetical protein